jgi:hypothetical protein
MSSERLAHCPPVAVGQLAEFGRGLRLSACRRPSLREPAPDAVARRRAGRAAGRARPSSACARPAPPPRASGAQGCRGRAVHQAASPGQPISGPGARRVGAPWRVLTARRIVPSGSSSTLIRLAAQTHERGKQPAACLRSRAPGYPESYERSLFSCGVLCASPPRAPAAVGRARLDAHCDGQLALNDQAAHPVRVQGQRPRLVAGEQLGESRDRRVATSGFRGEAGHEADMPGEHRYRA